MGQIVFAAVADDDTGASDLAGMLADQGVPTVLVLDTCQHDSLHAWTAHARAVVLATATRALSAAEAYQKTLSAVRLAEGLRPRTVQIKYCSTFDSTEQGNIGPSLDAALDALEERFTIALPALPVHGRTTYCGYHFVKGQLLSDSPMRHHPLTPMTESNLVAWLSRQTRRAVGLTPCDHVARGIEAVQESWLRQQAGGIGISILDCLSDSHASILCEAACDARLVSGGSAFGTHLPPAWRRRGWFQPVRGALWPDLRPSPGRGRLVLAGSCSVATSSQNVWLAQQGATVIECDPIALAEDDTMQAICLLRQALSRGETVLLKTQSASRDVERAQAWAASRFPTAAHLGLRISSSLASIVRAAIEDHLPEAIVSAGGETSGALCRALGISALAVDRNIQPGVPLCLPLMENCVPLVLKSGNFGTGDFYGASLAAAARLHNRT